MSPEPGRLEAFFHPRSIALVGASEQGMYPAGILKSLMENQFPGTLYPVNPRRAQVFGLPAYVDIATLPQPPDLAILTIPREGVLESVRQCIQRGVPAVCIITSGFAEADSQGKKLQAELALLTRDSQTSILGPNCAGLADVPRRMIATRLPVPPRPGSVAFTSQSGALMMVLYGLFADRRAGLSKLISLGNQVDLTLPDTLLYLAQDPATRVVAAFLEGLEEGRTFVEGARRLLEAGKPLVLLKSGRTASGQQAAATHTGALSGSDKVFSAACRQFGVMLVDDLHALVDTASLFSLFGDRLPAQPRLALVTQSGGLGSFSADLCETEDLELANFSPATLEALVNRPELMSFGHLGNPADVRGAAVSGARTKDTLAPFLEDPAVDMVVLLLAKQVDRPEDEQTAQAIIETSRQFSKPLAVVWVGGRYVLNPCQVGAHQALLEAGVPVFEQPGDCLMALGRLARYQRYRQFWLQAGEGMPDA